MESSVVIRQYLNQAGEIGVGIPVQIGGDLYHNIAWSGRHARMDFERELAAYGIEQLGELQPGAVPGAGLYRNEFGIEGVGIYEVWGDVEFHAIAWFDGTTYAGTKLDMDSRQIKRRDIEGQPPPPAEAKPRTEADMIREYLRKHGVDTKNGDVVEEFKRRSVKITSSQVSKARADLRLELEAVDA